MSRQIGAPPHAGINRKASSDCWSRSCIPANAGGKPKRTRKEHCRSRRRPGPRLLAGLRALTGLSVGRRISFGGEFSFVRSSSASGPWLAGLLPHALDTPDAKSLSGYLQRLGNAFLIAPVVCSASSTARRSSRSGFLRARAPWTVPEDRPRPPGLGTQALPGALICDAAPCLRSPSSPAGRRHLRRTTSWRTQPGYGNEGKPRQHREAATEPRSAPELSSGKGPCDRCRHRAPGGCARGSSTSRMTGFVAPISETETDSRHRSHNGAGHG